MRTGYAVLLCAAGLLMNAACTKETPVISEKDTVVREVTAYFPEDVKTTLQDAGTDLYWEPGDEIKLFSGGTGAKFTADCRTPSKTSTFSGTLDTSAGISDSTPLWGLYPYTEDAECDNVSVTTTLAAEQTGKAGSFASGTNISLAKSASKSMMFYNVCGGIRFCLTRSDVENVVFEAAGGENLAGETRLIFDGGVPLVGEVSGGQKSITLSAPAGETFEEGKWYYIVTLPCTLSEGFKMTFNTETKYAVLESTSPRTISRGVFGSISDADGGLTYKDKSSPSGQTPQWFELPEITYSDSNCHYAFHRFTNSSMTWRNYTVCFGAAEHCPIWVAAPRHSCYEGKSGRSDAYGPDPDIPSDIQYCSKSAASGCNKGHMLGSAERTCCTAANRQVFYYSNIAPQLSTTFNTGGGAWNNLEDKVDGYVCSDTLYVVIGCYFDDYTDAYGKTVNAKTISFCGRDDVAYPTMFYYALLRTKSGNSGKSLKDCTTDELKCVAFVLRHSMEKGHKPCADDMMSVSDLEKITGFSYFTNIPAAPKDSFKASDWGI